MSAIEDRLVAAFGAAREASDANADLFTRVNRSVEEHRERIAWRWRMARNTSLFAGALGVFALGFGDIDNGRFTMSWWLIELLANIVLVSIAVVLGPFIKRFGRSYAADVFRANPRTGKSYLVLTDVAYYLIFSAFILFTISFKETWSTRPDQWKHEVARLGGILLIMGILHAANVVALPVIGQMLSSNRLEGRSQPPERSTSTAGSPPLGPGTWLLRVEPLPLDGKTDVPPE
jgi:hypothetical protein